MNDPRQTSEWGDWAWEVLWPTSSGSSITYEDTPPVVISNPPIHVDLNTFQPYIQSVEEPLRKHQELERIRKAEERDAAKRQAEMLAEEAALSGNSSALPSTSAATSASGAPVLLLSDAQTYRNMALKDYRECKKVVPPVRFCCSADVMGTFLFDSSSLFSLSFSSHGPRCFFVMILLSRIATFF